jgi:hypothetical protein
MPDLALDTGDPLDERVGGGRPSAEQTDSDPGPVRDPHTEQESPSQEGAEPCEVTRVSGEFSDQALSGWACGPDRARPFARRSVV